MIEYRESENIGETNFSLIHGSCFILMNTCKKNFSILTSQIKKIQNSYMNSDYLKMIQSRVHAILQSLFYSNMVENEKI